MEKEQIQDLAIQFASEGLNGESQMVYDAWVLTATDADKNMFAEMIDLCADISISGAKAHPEKVAISESVKSTIFKELGKAQPIPDTKLIREADQEWINLPVKGAKLLELSARKRDGFVMSIIEVEPGTGFPAHDHHGVEMAYILEGDLEADGILLNAGDFFRADTGTHHGENFSPSGCRALIVTSGENYNHGVMKTLGSVQKVYRKIKGVFAK